MLKNLKNLEKAVSPVIGVILMVAITIVMAAIVGVFAFDIMPEEPAPIANINIIVEDNQNFRIEHLGGDAIPNVYNRGGVYPPGWNTAHWVNLQVQINERVVGIDAPHWHVAHMITTYTEYNRGWLPWGIMAFNLGDVLRFRLAGAPNLVTGDVITVVHVPTETVIARHVVAI